MSEVECPQCKHDNTINWAEADYLTEFDRECDNCNQRFQVIVEMLPVFSSEIRRCSKCHKTELNNDQDWYCTECHTEIRKQKEQHAASNLPAAAQAWNRRSEK